MNENYLLSGMTQKTMSVLSGLAISTIYRWIIKNEIQPINKLSGGMKGTRYFVGDTRKFFLEYGTGKKEEKKKQDNKSASMAFYNFKGGTGKTTICYQVSSMLAILGFDVLVIDADVQGHLSISLGIDPRTDYPTLCDVLKSRCSINESIQSIFPGLDCIPSNASLTWVESFLFNENNREAILAEKLAGIEKKYDFILFDMNPLIGHLNRSILAYVDLINFVCETQPYSLIGLDTVLNDTKEFFKGCNLDLPKMLVIPNKYDCKSVNSTSSMSILATNFSEYLVDNLVVRKSEEFASSTRKSVPLPFFTKASSIALEDIKDLSFEIIKIFQNDQNNESIQSLESSI